MFKKNSVFTPYAPLIIAIAIIAGLFLGRYLYSDVNNKTNNIFEINSSNKLSSLLDIIERDYVDSVNMNKLVEQAIPEVLAELDPHSIYIPAKDIQRIEEPMKGSFDGIGIQFNMQKDTVLVISVISGGPSEKVGILPGDRIVTINDSIFAGKGLSTDEIIKNLKGERGTIVKVGVKRHGVKDLIQFEIERDKIPLYSIDVSYMVNKNIGYIKISRFAQTTYIEFVQAIEKLKAKGMKKLILDLRGNTGGYLNQATKICDEFLKKDKLIVYTEGKARPRTNYYASDNNLYTNDPLIVLVDTWSASASEIIAGAIQDNDRGTIIGRRTFGKGLVQEPMVFKDKSVIRLTIARYYTPTGRCIQKSYENKKAYETEIMERMRHGEFEEKDSIQFNDSLKYTTPKGKIVYGGGGIMPDIFVPVDTTGNSKYFQKASSTGAIYRFALDYTDKNRQTLSQLKTADEISRYLDNNQILKKFITYAKNKHKISPQKNDLQISGRIIKTQVKAYIARNIIDNEGFYPIIQELDNVLIKAIDEIKKID